MNLHFLGVLVLALGVTCTRIDESDQDDDDLSEPSQIQHHGGPLIDMDASLQDSNDNMEVSAAQKSHELLSSELQTHIESPDAESWLQDLGDLTVDHHKKCNEFSYSSERAKNIRFEGCDSSHAGTTHGAYCHLPGRGELKKVYLDMDGTTEQHDWLAHDVFYHLNKLWTGEDGYAQELQKCNRGDEDACMGIGNVLTQSLRSESARGKVGGKAGLRAALDAVFDQCYPVENEADTSAEVNQHPYALGKKGTSACENDTQKREAFLHRYFNFPRTCGSDDRLGDLVEALSALKAASVELYTMSAAWEAINAEVWADYIHYMMTEPKFGLTSLGEKFDGIRTISAWSGKGNKGGAIAKLNGNTAVGVVHCDNSFSYMEQVVACTRMQAQDDGGIRCRGNGGGIYVKTHTGLCGHDITHLLRT